jgi:uncharacterized protein (TIGR04255 family)
LPEISYKRNFLTEVIARIDFASPIQKLNQELPPKVSERALKAFPIQEPRKAIGRELQISPVAVESKNIEFTEWNFYGKEREKRFVLFNQAMFVAYNRYPKYEPFKKDFIDVLEVLFNEIPEVVPNRLGLRYINNFEIPNGDPFNWDEYFNQHLLSSHRFYEDKTAISRVFNNLEFNFQDFNLRFQFGMPNPDYPAPIKKKHFVLDLDAYHQGLQTFQEIPGNLDRYHTQIQTLFESSITDKLREVFNA